MASGLVVIPAFNEGEHIAEVLQAVMQSAPEFDVLVVDDASRDTTAEIARANGATVVTHPFNMGYGAALQTAYRYALRSDYKVVVQLDAGEQHDPTSVSSIMMRSVRMAGASIEKCPASRFFRKSSE